MQPTQDALIESKVPPGHEQLVPGTITKEGDLIWNFLEGEWQKIVRFSRIGKTVKEGQYIIRKTNQEQTVSQGQAPKPNYGLW